MSIELKYTTIPSADKVVASNFYKRVFGFESSPHKNLKINEQLTFKFKTCDSFNILHFAFNVDTDTFGKIVNNIEKEDICFSNNPFTLIESNTTQHQEGKTTIYFRDPNGHIIEVSKE